MENDRLSNYLRARLRAITYPCDSGVDDEAVSPQPAIHTDQPSNLATPNTMRERQDLTKASA